MMQHTKLVGACVAVAAVVLCVPLLHADDGGGQPLYCFTQNVNSSIKTFFPRGDHFAHLPGAKITVVFNPNGAMDSNVGLTHPNAADSIAAVQAAYSAWQSQDCGGAPPDITFDTGGTAGMTAVSQDGINTVNWLAKWTFDQTTVAATTNSYGADTGFMVDADMQFNSQYFAWRNNAKNSGCTQGTASDPNGICYDIYTVALHEIGHFIGLNHTACAGSTMFPSLASTSVATVGAAGIGENERAGICALYPPHTGTGSSFSQACTTTSDCQSGLTCLKPAGAADDDKHGWCTKVCTSSAGCPLAYVCESVNTQGPVCVPGVHLANLPVSDAVAAQGLCQPCAAPSWCDTGLCVTGADGTGLCMQPCAKDGTFACPTNFACIQPGQGNPTCYPVDDYVCSAVWTGAKLNDTCYNPAINSNQAYVNCQAGLQCLLLPTGLGACLQYCDASSAGATCAPGSECCFGFDPNTGACLNSGALASGGCVQIQSVGDSCGLPSQSICQDGACLSQTEAENAQCYGLCDGDGKCPTGEKCYTGLGVCCDSQYYNGNPNTCFPKSGVCKRDTDVACSTAADCSSGLCQTYNGQSFCTVACVLNSDCPGVDADVNGDSKPDGGATCLQVDAGSAKKVCVPNTGPAAMPACATPASAKSGGCGCAGTGPADMWWLAALVAVAFLRLRRTC